MVKAGSPTGVSEAFFGQYYREEREKGRSCERCCALIYSILQNHLTGRKLSLNVISLASHNCLSRSLSSMGCYFQAKVTHIVSIFYEMAHIKIYLNVINFSNASPVGKQGSHTCIAVWVTLYCYHQLPEKDIGRAVLFWKTSPSKRHEKLEKLQQTEVDTP